MDGIYIPLIQKQFKIQLYLQIIQGTFMNNKHIAQTKSLENQFKVKGINNFHTDVDLSDPSIPVIGYSPSVEQELLAETPESFLFDILKLKPCNHQVLASLLYEGVTKAGIHLSDTAAISKVKAMVISVDESIAANDKVPANMRGLKKGDVVVFPPRAYQELNEPGQDSSGIVLIALSNILAIYDTTTDKE